MCPNINKDSEVCPGIKGTPHPEPSECRFVKSYIDSRGWIYEVMYDEFDKKYKGHYKRPEVKNWCRISHLELRDTFDHAQRDLNKLSEKKGWKEMNK